MNNNQITRGGKSYTGYDYKTVTTDSEQASMLLDAYENFGWMPDESMPPKEFAGSVTLKLKRDRKIANKAELTRLQQHFEACMDEIAAHEKSKTQKATAYSIIVGVIGMAFLAGSVFAVTAEPPIVWLCVVLGIPGLIGWVLPMSLFKAFTRKRIAELEPLIDQKYDEMHDICEKGNALIH